MRGRRSYLLALSLVVALARTAMACDVPVFRYALERWEPEPYQAVLLNNAPLDASEEALWRGITEHAEANPRVLPIGRGTKPDPGLEARWQADSATPWIALYYPPSAPLQTHVWSGPLTAANCEALLDSPARQEIARQLLDGTSAVFALLESGDAAADQNAADTLARELAASETSLVLPGRTKEDVPDIDESKVRIEFSTVRVSRQDPHEAIFVEMLLGIEPGLRDIDAPMVFPVYGRGRALYALAGKGINAKTIRAACALVVGPCSCQVKDENPGVDVLMATDWVAGIDEFLLQNPEPAALPSPALHQASAPVLPDAAGEGWSPGAALLMAMAVGLVATLAVSLAISLRKVRAES
ncbi:MAG: hypothetical protein IT364_14400 [Candidatus Hydrogenedentes bacterium]|nr:hypothetical protein [Candidatus Hydrogenedentota bacterium]